MEVEVLYGHARVDHRSRPERLSGDDAHDEPVAAEFRDALRGDVLVVGRDHLVLGWQVYPDLEALHRSSLHVCQGGVEQSYVQVQ